MSPSGRVVQVVRRRLDALGLTTESGPALIVAFSGGLDSCVLLHVLRFALPTRPSLIAVHFDHGMRPGSGADSSWIRGLCRSWDVDVVVGRAGEPPASEGAARRARYEFFESVRRRSRPARVLLAHHADDQAETVLFRVLRGTGIAGLRGIPETREPGIVRPMLTLWRKDLETYAASAGLSWREDLTNEHLGYARNLLRHRVLPMAEAGVAPGSRKALVRLAGVARREEAAWSEALAIVLRSLDLRTEGDGARSLDREALAALTPELRARVLRRLVRQSGRRLDASATRRAIEFVETGRSGRRIELGGGVELRRELDRVVVGASVPPFADRPLRIEAAGTGEGEAVLGGRPVPVRWSTDPESTDAAGASFEIDRLVFPLEVRGRRAGDRIELSGGTRKLKKLLLEERIPSALRASIPLLADACGRVLWIPGVARSAAAGEASSGAPARLWIRIGP